MSVFATDRADEGRCRRMSAFATDLLLRQGEWYPQLAITVNQRTNSNKLYIFTTAVPTSVYHNCAPLSKINTNSAAMARVHGRLFLVVLGFLVPFWQERA